MAFKMTSPFHAIGDPKKSASQEGSAGRNADDLARKNNTGIYAPSKRPRAGKTLNEMGKVKLESKGVQTGDYGKGTKNKKGVVKGLDVKAPEISTKKPTVKPKDNSRKAIRQRKKADKSAGVSKSQMRANKAKSKSEAFMAKAKASKDPSMRAQLKRKSDRLAKRAARKGGSPAKAVGDPKDPKKKYGKVTVKKEKKGNTTTITATRPYSTTKGKKTYKQFEKEGGNVAAAKKFNKGSDTKSITVVDKKQIGAKKLSATPKPKISSAKPSVDKDYGSFTFGSNARNMKSGGHSTYGRTAAGKTTKHSQSYTESPKKPMSGKDNIAKSRKITAKENQLMKSDLYNQKYHPMKNKKEFDTHLGNIEKFEKRKNDKKFANKKITDKRSIELNAKKDALKARQDATRAKRAKNKK